MNILRVNMCNPSLTLEILPKNWTIIGGRALTAKILNDEVPPSIDPLGAAAKLVITCGPLSGTRAPSFGRISIGAKSPLTYGIKEANSGGPFAQKMDRLGIRAIIIEGAAKNNALYMLKISGSDISLINADQHRGHKNYELAKSLSGKYGKKISIISTGVAGERYWKSASITLTDNEGNSSRHAARGGLGAVMGSRGLKAIFIDDQAAKKPIIAHKGAFKRTIKNWTQIMKKDLMLKNLSRFGTPGMISSMQFMKSMPVENYQNTELKGVENLSGEAIEKKNRQRGGKMTACMPGCLVKCSIEYLDKKKKYQTSNLQYQTIALMGTNLGITDADLIAKLDFLCDNLGVDSIEIGAALGVAAEAGFMKMGDPESLLNLLDEIERGTELGAILGNGVAETCKAFGITRIPAYKGQAIPAHDPRVAKTAGVSYATSPMGADHTTGISYQSCSNEKDHVSASLEKQITTSIIDATGFCLLASPEDRRSLITFIKDLLNARYDLDITDTDLIEIGKQSLKDELIFNQGSEFHSIHEPDPEFIRNEAVGVQNDVFNVGKSQIDTIWNQLESFQ